MNVDHHNDNMEKISKNTLLSEWNDNCRNWEFFIMDFIIGKSMIKSENIKKYIKKDVKAQWTVNMLH